MKDFINKMNTIFGTFCMCFSVYGLITENYLMACAYALFFIAFQQQEELK